MSTEMTKVAADYYGRSVELLKAPEGVEWATSEIVAGMLGYEGAGRTAGEKVAKLFRLHRAEFIEGTEFAFAPVTVPVTRVRNGVPHQGEQRHRKLIFTLRGIDHLALLSKTATGARVRRWVVDRMEAERNGTVRVVTADQLGALKAEIERMRTSHAAEIALYRGDLRALADQAHGTTKLMASLASQILHWRKANKSDEEQLIDSLETEVAERARGQHFLTPPPGAHAVTGN